MYKKSVDISDKKTVVFVVANVFINSFYFIRSFDTFFYEQKKETGQKDKTKQTDTFRC